MRNDLTKHMQIACIIMALHDFCSRCNRRTGQSNHKINSRQYLPRKETTRLKETHHINELTATTTNQISR